MNLEVEVLARCSGGGAVEVYLNLALLLLILFLRFCRLLDETKTLNSMNYIHACLLQSTSPSTTKTKGSMLGFV